MPEEREALSRVLEAAEHQHLVLLAAQAVWEASPPMELPRAREGTPMVREAAVAAVPAAKTPRRVEPAAPAW